MNNARTLSKLAILVTVLLLFSGIVSALTLNSVTPAWSNVTGSSGDPTCLTIQTVGAEEQVRFGDDDIDPACPGDINVQSGFGFEGGGAATFASGEPFVLGELIHYNNPIFPPASFLETADLDLTIDFGDPVHNDVFSTTVTLDETANDLSTCPYGDSQPCADRISIERQSFAFNLGPGADYQFEIIGMIPGTLGSCVYDESQISTSFISDENASNSACLFGTVTTVAETEFIITKDADVTSVEPGDFINYQIDYNCFSQTTDCNDVVLVDFLPDEVNYVGSVGSTHTLTAAGIYSAGNHSVRFEFDNPLRAGSTGFVRIRAQVRDTGQVPNGTPITNTAVSTASNTATSTAEVTMPLSTVSNWTVDKVDPGTIYLSTDPPVTNTTYTVQICSNGSTVDLLNAQMVDTLPDDVVFLSATGSPVYDAGPPQTLTWDLGDLQSSSGCTSRQVTVQFPEPTFSEAQNVTNTVDASGDPVGEPSWTDSDSVTNPLSRLTPDPRATLDKVSDRDSYVVGAIAQFRLSPSNTGNVPLQNFTMSDILPPQLEVTRITVGSYSGYNGQVTVRYMTSDNVGNWVDWPGGPFDDNNQTLQVSSLGLPGGVYVAGLQWYYGTANPGFSTGSAARIYARIVSPDHNGDPVNDGDSITNDAELYWDYPPGNDGEGISGTELGSATLTIDVIPTPQFDKSSAGGVSATWRFLIGQQVGYYTLYPNNNSGVALDAFTITDTIPPQFDVTSVTVGQYSNFDGQQVTLRYQTNQNSWQVWPGSPFEDNNQSLSVSSLGLGGSEYITGVQWDFGTIQPDFSASIRPRINGAVINPDHNGDPVNDGDSMSNSAIAEWTYQGEPDDMSDTQVDTVREPIAEPAPQKTVTSTGPYIPSSLINYRLRVMASGSSPSVLINPIVMDLLPADLIYDPGSWSYDPGSTGVAAPVFEEIPNYDGTGRTLLRWTFNGTFAQGQAAYINFDAAIGPGAALGDMVNEYYITSNDIPIIPNTTDTGDLDGDGDDGDDLNGTGTAITIDELVGLDSVKGVRGQLDGDFSVYPDTGLTIPNGSVTYRLSIINEGNIPIQNVRVIDILPFVGDTGVQDIRPRGSEWRPVLTGLVSSPAGVTVYYSTSGNPCRPEIVSSGPAGCTAPNWSTLPPADISTVQSLRFDFAGTLTPGQSFNFTWSMQAPPDASEGTIAWNSFAFTSTNAQTGYPLRPAEPNKVGIELTRPEVAPLIQLEKATNGEDADFPTGPLVPLSDPVTWTYVITNTGNTRLADITLTDDIIDPLVCNEGPIPNLDANDSFTCTVIGVATSGQYANVGTVEGTPVSGEDDPLTDPDSGDPLPPVTDEDPSHYLGYDPNLARLGDRVWVDQDGDGVQDGGEPGLPGITVHLRDSEDTIIDTTTTNGSGFYYFVDLDPGQYSVQFVLPGVYSFTLQNEGGDDTLDSDADITTGATELTTLAAAENDPSWDAGVVAPASIGDYVWYDVNDNGVQDDGEEPASGITVNLLDSGGTVIDTTITDEDGIYRFIDLPPGEYGIEVIAPDGYTFSLPDLGGDDEVDSDVERSTGRTAAPTLLTPSENDPTWDAGLVPLASIGNFVWADMDNDGIQDGAETGVENVTVTLYDSGDNVVDTMQTNSLGAYNFTDVIPGDYYIVVTLPDGYMFSPQDQGANNSVDSDVDTTTGQSATTTLDPNEDDPTWDAGLVPLASIGDYVWLDIDNDGRQDGGETGFASVTVNLLDSGGAQIDTTTTDGDGLYLFDDLVPGQYAIEVIPPANYVFSPQNVGGDSGDSDVDRSTGRTINTTLAPGEDDLTWDAGLVPDASIGDYVWYDNNNNGIQDGGDTPAENITVNLLNSGGTVIDTTTTNASGNYLFDHLTPGTYALEFVDPAGYAPAIQDAGGDDTVDSDADRFTGRTINTTLDPDEDDLTWDMGLVLSASIGDRVWRDNNGDSEQTGGEPGVSGVTVNLLDSGGTQIDTTTTDGTGNYLFDDLPPDDYAIEVVLPDNYVFSLQDQTGDTIDSDVDIDTGQTIVTTLDPDEDDLTWDAGLIPVASIGDYVWRDNDNDGVQDGTEVGIQGVTVTLYDSGDNEIDTTTTDADGLYLFDDLRPGDYYLNFALPAGYLRSPQDATGDSADSDANITTGDTIVTTLDPDEDDRTWDAGLTPLASIGNFVWRDNDDDGVQDGGEPGVAGVTVNLLDSGGTEIDTTTTASDGSYLFDLLEAGTYIIEVELPDGFIFSDQNQGADDTVDSDVDTTTGRTVSVALDWGEEDLTWDAGLVPLASIGNYVWYDADDDGLQDGGESGVENITVTLYDDGDNEIDTTTTAGDGSYLFEDLEPGDYYLVFTLPAGHVFSRPNEGANDAVDSDASRVDGSTTVTTLAPGENDLTWDAGIMETASIGDRVWEDVNDNGIQDGGESGVENITVTLYDGDDNEIDTTTTDGAGNYGFTDLIPGDYYVVFSDLPVGYVFSRLNVGADDTVDSDANRTTGATAVTTLLPGEDDLTWDAGIMEVASIGDRVWEDVNDNGIQDGGESGYGGVTVTLYDSGDTEIDTTTTAGDGSYSFTDLVPGDYYVVFTLPDGYAFSRPNEGADDTVDSDANRTTGATTVTTLLPGEDDPTWDAGIMEVASIGNFVWDDLNADGVQDGGEPGIENVTVTLYDSDDNEIDTTTTDADGLYLFEDVTPGDYYIVFTLPTDYIFSPQDDTGATDATDSDADTTTGATITTDLDPGEDDLTWDAGMYQLASFGDLVWDDLNADGVQDGGEPGIENVTVTLYDGDDNEIDDTTTDSNGNYLFDDLEPGDYYVVFTLPTDYVFSPQDDTGATDATDSDADTTTGATVDTTLISGENDLTWDAGMYQFASIGNYVWHDTNANGVQDGGEPGLQGVTVTLYDGGNNEIDTTTTDADGLYLFEDLVPGDYYVDFTPLTDYNISPQDAGADDTVDSDADPATGQTATTDLTSGESDLTWDAGMYQYASVGDYVWHDTNANGVQDGGEPGLQGVTVTLYDSDDNEIDTTTTDADGLYLFEDVVPGDYYIVFTPLTDYNISPQDAGADDTIDSDADTTTYATTTITLSSNEEDLTWDAGMYQYASLGDRVWSDTNDNGIQDGGEPGVENVTVTLYDGDDNEIDTTTTDGTGNYLFEDLVPGDYYVEFTLPDGYVFSRLNEGADDTVDSDADRADGTTEVTTLVSGENDLTWDAGIMQVASLGDYVWDDLNADGVQDGGETGIENVTVTLYDSGDNEIDTTTTDGDGLYLFEDVVPGDYYVVFTLPTDYVFSPQDDTGATDATDSDADTTTGATIVTTLLPGENDLTWDAGMYQYASLGDRVWEDTNDNGIQDGGENGYSGVIVTLYDGDDNEIDTTATDGTGLYLFDDLVPGDYYVVFTLPTDYVFSRLDEGADDTADSDANRTDGSTIVTTLISGENDLTWDAGIMAVASLGDTVWEDLNDNGVQDGGEPGVENVTVTLYDGDDNEIDSTTTDGDGLYLFEDLVPGDYYVVFSDLPVDYVFSRLDEGADDTVDSDADRTTGATTVTTLLPGEDDLTWDAGIMETASLGDFVWNDLNDNGIQDGGEPGVTGITVTLYDGDDNEIDTTTTDGTGSYLFDDLVPGDYYVVFSDLPVDYVFSRQDDGADDTIDSDADRTTGATTVTTLLPGENDLTWDAGIMETASLGDRVWNDLNDNGIQDGGEPGVENVTVTLYDGDDNEIDTTATDGTGNYLFDDLVPGDYYVIFSDLPVGYVFSRLDEGADDTVDSDADRTTGATTVTTLLPGENDLTWDAGIMETASLGDYVWEDLNDNGVQDGGEPGVENVTVTLYDGDDNEIDTTTTDGDGLYLFEDLVPGDYYVVFTLPTDYVFSRLDEGADDTADSDADRTTGATVVTNLLPGENDLTWDAGIMQVASIGDTVWEDLNDNGIQDGGEDGYPGVTVTLYDSDDNEIDTTTTDGDGNYLFDDLVPGDYYAVFTLPDGYVFSRQDEGADDTVDSDADRDTGTTETITLTSGENDLTWDAGIMAVASIGDRVWLDTNANGEQDGGEDGYPGVTVTLYDGDDNEIDTTTTDGDGNYLFEDLVPGDYYLIFTLPADREFSPQNATGVDAADDSDADITTGTTVDTTLLPGENDLTWDAGIYQLASIGNFVWDDLNADGIQDTGEIGVPGVTVNLLDNTLTQINTTTTDADGFYSFIVLVPSEYTIEFELPTGYIFSPQDAGADDTADSDADTTTGRAAETTLISGENDLTWDAGIYQLASIGDTVWEDLNADGVQDAGELGIEGVTVNLLDDSLTEIDTTTTDINGNYSFVDLVPGEYAIEFELLVDYYFSPQDTGADDAADSDADRTTGRTITTMLVSGEDDPTWDAGIYRLIGIGDTVWLDSNADGLQDPDEEGVADVLVTLRSGVGAVLDTMTTDEDGFYQFIDLVPGDYTVEFELPVGYVFTEQDAGNNALDSDANTDTGRTIVTDLISDEYDPTWDAGLLLQAAIGDTVWEDINYNGIQDDGEPGVAGVTVNLYAGGGIISTATTDSDGNYGFIHLNAGEYQVEFILPDGYTFTKLDQGADDAEDSDADVDTGMTELTQLFWGETDPTWDAGIVLLGTLGDRVWLDTNRNGEQESNERGIGNVTLTLVLPDGTQQTDVTDEDGFYLFEQLPPGSYNVTVDLNTLPPGLTATYDLDGGLDSTATTPLGSGETLLTVDFGYAPVVIVDGVTGTEWVAPNACQRVCVDWMLYHSNQTGDWEIFRLGDLSGSISPNLSQGEDADDMAPTRSPNAEWIVFSSNRDGNWELYLAPADGDGSDIRRLTYNTIALDTDPAWGPNNFVVFETTRNGNWDLYLLDMSTGRTRQLTDSPASDLNAFWSPDGSKLIFQSDRSGQWQIYELDLATLNTTLLSDGEGNDTDPQYDNSGARIAFRTDRYSESDNSVVTIMNADGSSPRPVSDPAGDATNHSWSPDDSLIAYQSDLDGDLDVYVYETGSGQTRQLTDNDIDDYAPTWQCGTNHVVFTSDVNGNPDIFDADPLPISAPAIVVDETAEQLTFDQADDIYPEGAPTEENASREGRLPDLTETSGAQTSFLLPDVATTEPDTSLETGEDWQPINSCPVACVAWSLYHSDRSGSWDIFRLGDISANISQSSGDDLEPSRSPDAGWVAFTSDRDGSREIYITAANGTQQQRVTFNDATDSDPVWSPNSQFIVYESDRDGNWNLYLFDVFTGQETQLTDDPADDLNAAWSSAGGSLFFQSDRSGSWQIYRLNLSDGTVSQLTDLPGNAYEPLASATGSLIAFRFEETDGQSVLYLMQEDGTDLQAISDPAGRASNQNWYYDDTLLAYQSDLDGDLDIYVYEIASGQTRQLTDNTIADYAPSWQCGEANLLFTSEATGNAQIFEALALPLDAAPLNVETDATQLTTGSATNRYPVGTPSEENASRAE